MRRALALAALGVVVGCGAAAAQGISVRLLARPGATVGVAWSAGLAVSPTTAGRPEVVARSGATTRVARVTPRGRSRYSARLTFPAAGRWRLEARLRGRRFALGAVTVRAPLPRAPDSVTEPFAVALGPDGSVLVADRVAGVLRLDPSTGRATELGDVHEPLDLAVGPDGAVYAVSDYRVLRLDPATGGATPVAGTGANRFGGDGGPATAASLFSPDSIGFDAAGNLYVAEYENRVRRVDRTTGVITTVAGTGETGFAGDGGPATAASFHHPHGLAVAPDGTLYVADASNHRIRRIDGPTGVITTVAGTGETGFRGDGGPATAAAFNVPIHVALAPDGALFVSDGVNQRIRRVGRDGVVRTVAGNGRQGSSGDGGPATRASLDLPNQVAVASDGTFYVAEFEGRRVRRVDGATSRITTLAR